MKLQHSVKVSFILISFIIIAFISHILILHSHVMFPADDMQFQLNRINELLSFHGNLFTPFAFNYFHGAATMTFYPYLNLVPIIFLHYFFKSKIILVYVYFIINTFISLNISFFSSLSIDKKDSTSYVFSIIYSLSNVFMGYNYGNMDIGLVTAVTFLPLVIFGFIHLIYDGRYGELSVGIILISFCHILSIIIITMFLGVFLLINVNKLNKKKFINILKTILIVTLITSVEWIPMLYYSHINNINFPVSQKLQGVPTKIIVKSFFGGMSEMGLGTFVILAMVLSIFYWRKFTNLYKQFYIISVVVILICSKLFPWNLLPNILSMIFAHFQFTYRFLTIPILLLSYIFSIIITQMIDNKHLSYILIILSLIFAVGIHLWSQQHFIDSNINHPPFSANYPNRPCKITNSSQLNKFLKYVPKHVAKINPFSDYYPKDSIFKSYYINHNRGMFTTSNNKQKIVNIKRIGNNLYLFNTSKKINRLKLPLIHYKGEKLHVYVNHHLVHYQTSKNSLITLSGINSGNNRIEVQYVPNILLVTLQDVLFLIGLIWLIIIII